MLKAVPRTLPAAALVGALLGSTFVCDVASAKPRDFGTTSRPSVDRAASPASVSSVQVTIDNAPVCTAPYDQFSQYMVGDASGSSLNVWTDYRAGNLDIYAQKLNPSGGSSWVNNGAPVCKDLASQSAPKAIPDGSGGVIVVWEDGRPGATKDIYAQRLDAFGSAMWTSNGIAVCNAAGNQLTPVMVSDGSGGAIIAWVDDRAGGSDVYAQRLNAAGAAQWTANGVAMCAATGIQRDLSITSDQNHGAYVAWQDQRTDALGDIYAQRINSAGAPQGTANGTALCTAAGAQESPILVADGASGLIAGWTDRRGTDADLYAQRMNGTVQWIADGMPLCLATGDQTALRMCSDAAGGAIAAWQDLRGGSSDLYVQRVGAAGTPQWAIDGAPLCAAVGEQIMPEIQRDPAGGALVTWSDARSGATGPDVYAQRITGSGAAQWTADGVQLCDAPDSQDSPLTVPDGVGGAFVVWRDARAPYTDLYGQQVDAAGLVSNQCAGLDTLRESIPQTVTAEQNYRVFNNLLNNFPIYFWAGVAVRGAPGGDWDLEAYDTDSWGQGSYPSCFGMSLAGSNSASGVDFIMFDQNELRTPPGVYGVRPHRYSGAGNATVEFDGGASSLVVSTSGSPQPVTSAPDWTGVIDTYDVTMTAGVTYTFDFVRNPSDADLRLYFFSSLGSPDYYYVVPGSQRAWDTQSRYYQWTPPSNGYYGVVVVNETGAPAQYVLNVYSNTPVGVGDAPTADTGIQGVTPNPTQGNALIKFSLREAAKVSFDVLDMAGRVVSRIPARDWAAGRWSLDWDGRGENAARLSPGMYFVQMHVNGRRMGLGRVALVR